MTNLPGSSSVTVAPRPGRSGARGSLLSLAPPPDQSSPCSGHSSVQMLLSLMRRPYRTNPPSFVGYARDMRASRLVSLLLLLQTRGQLTAADLAGQLEVSE